MLKVVQERSRVSPASRGRVAPPQNFLIYFLSENGVIGGILCDLELQESKQETVIDPAYQRVPGLRPWRPGPTLGLSPDHITLQNIG